MKESQLLTGICDFFDEDKCFGHCSQKSDLSVKSCENMLSQERFMNCLVSSKDGVVFYPEKFRNYLGRKCKSYTI